MDLFIIPLIFATIAFLYSSVGFGGGSSYLAILVLFEVAFIETRFIALACNMVVVGGSSILFIRKDLIIWKKVMPLVVLSIPMAWLGGTMLISENVFFVLLGLSLIVAGPAMLLRTSNHSTRKVHSNKYANAFIGGGIGLLSGLVGIGGGIFLAPVLHLMHWDQPKRIAATASFFILVNSIAGMIGQLNNARFEVDTRLLLLCLGAVLIGGQIGARSSIRNLSSRHLRILTAVLVLFVGIRVLIKYMG